MKKKLLMIIIICISTLVSGCSKKTEEKSENTAVVIIAGRHANANLYTDNMLDDIEKTIKDSFVIEKEDDKYVGKGQVHVVVSDGMPTEQQIEYDEMDDDGYLSVKRNTKRSVETSIDKFVNKIKEGLVSPNLKADDEEVDLLSALDEASLILNQYDEDVKKKIIILDTGINTTGYLNMRNFDIQNQTPDEILNELGKEALPNLKNINVKFIGLGNVAEPQKNPKNYKSCEDKLKDLWEKVLKKSGAVIEGPINYSNTQGIPMVYVENGSQYPYVSTVEFESDSSKAHEAVSLPASSLDFKVESAEFEDENQAIYVINKRTKAMAEYLSENKDEKIYVVGSVAKVTENDNLKTSHVSKERAEKVTDILINHCGIDKNRIITIDAGTTEFSWRDSPEFVNGKKNEENQQKNRLVRIIPSSVVKEVNELEKAGYIS